MSKGFIQSQLDAGGLVAVDAKCDPKTTERIVARTYTAPVLGDRVVITLSADRLVPAEDLAMEFLGLEGRAISEPIAMQTRTALDFAHWALINQPKHAKYALDLVKRMKSTARKAASKPGAAWDLYTAMADDLNKSVKDFLPPFWEQVARTFKELGNQTYAGRGLNKALEAERVHALIVDREHRRDAVLEFALSGCLSGKALSDYAKDLERQFKPAEAYETFKDLVIRRTLGGMPPVTNVATDLNRMAKAAKLDPVAELESVLEAIITSPAMARASIQFWKSVKQAAARIVKRDRAFAAWLLVHTNPQSSYRTESPVWQWLDLLDEWDVLPMISQPLDQWPKEVELPGGRSHWIGAIASVESSPNKRVFELLESMVDVLKAEGKPISLTSGARGRSMDVDVLETCLDLGLEVPFPEWLDLDFDGWLRQEVDHPRRNSQLKNISAEPRLMVALENKVPTLVAFTGDGSGKQSSWSRTVPNRRSFEEAAAGHPVLRDAWWNYLDKQVKAFEVGGLMDVDEANNRLLECIRPRVVAEFPELGKRLQQIDFAAILQRSLNAGVLDEYGWPALDKAADEKSLPKTSRRHDTTIFPSFPRLAYWQDGFVHVIDPDSICPPRELKLNKTEQVVSVLPLGNDIMIMVRDTAIGWNTFGRWYSEPNKSIQQEDGYYYGSLATQIAQIGEDEFFCGARAVRLGDAQWPRAGQPWFHDGERFWRLNESGRHWMHHTENDEARSALAEIDPRTGTELRDSVPPFFEESLPSGGIVAYQFSYLMPQPKQQGDSPLGSKNGLIGWRAVRRRDGTFECQGIDGRKYVVTHQQTSARGYSVAEAMIDKPGTKSHWVLLNDGRLIDTESGIAFGAYGNHDKYAHGQPTSLPFIFFNLLRPRCLESSKTLRKLNHEQASELLDAGYKNHEAYKKKEDPTNPDPERTIAFDTTQRLLPKAPSRLIAGVARLARVAAEEMVSLQGLLKRVLPDPNAPQVAPPTFDALRADKGLEFLVKQKRMSRYFYGSSEEHSLAASVTAVGKFLSGDDSQEMPPCDTYWFHLLDELPVLAWKCFWVLGTNHSLGETVPERLNGPWIDALNCFAESGLLRFSEKMQLYHSMLDADHTPNPDSLVARASDKLVTVIEGDCRYVATVQHGYPNSCLSVLGYSPSGKLKPPKGMTVDETIVVEPGWNRNHTLAFVRGVKATQVLPLPSPEQISDAAKTLGVHPVSPALVWMGNLRTVQHGQEKLTKELRDFYSWKVNDVQAAIAELDATDLPTIVTSIGVRNNPGGAMLDGRDRAFSQMVAKWADSRKKKVSLPADLVKKLNSGGPYRNVSINLITDLIADPAASEFLQRRTVTLTATGRSSVHNQIRIEYSPKPQFDPAALLNDVITAIAMIHYELPVGAEARVAIPEVVDQIRTFLDDPSTMFSFGASFVAPLGTEFNLDEVIGRVGAAITKLEMAPDGLYRGDNGLIVVACAPPVINMLFRTAKLRDDKDLAKLAAAVGATFDYSGPVEALGMGAFFLDTARTVMRMRGESISRMADEIRDSKLPEGSWEQDPRLSAADVVKACAKKLKASESAATLYLQVLALHDPTAANVKRWNQWSTKEYAAAAKELVEAAHLVEAKRERAGRDVFLPGGWEPLKIPNLPIESWKLPLFGYTNTDRLRGGGAERIVLHGSIAAHFRSAWSRIEQGDVPRYEEVATKKKRK